MLAAAGRAALRGSRRLGSAAGKPTARGLSWVKDVTVNVTFVNHEVRPSCFRECQTPVVAILLLLVLEATHQQAQASREKSNM